MAHKKLFITPVVIGAMVASTGAAVAYNAAEDSSIASLSMAQHAPVEDTYIVLTTSAARSDVAIAETAKTAAASARESGAEVKSVLEAIGGYTARMTPAQVEAARRTPGVTKVMQARKISTFDNKLPAETNDVRPQANVVSWGLDRIDQRDLPIDDRFETPNTGRGVHAYVIDSGIKASHPEFENRVGRGYDFYNNDSNPDDCLGHGTHVASTVGGKTAGVAPDTTLHALRVMDCEGNGDDSIIITAADWIIRNAEYPAVVNMSFGAEYGANEESTMDTAVNRLADAGIVSAIAAGNSSKKACGTSPARAPRGITVGSTYKNDDRSFFSNHGKCLDLFAPGSMIEGADFRNNELRWESGTSMAAPHVAGAAALYLARYSDAKPAEIEKVLVDRASVGKVNDPRKESPNKLLYVRDLFAGGRPTPTNPVPTGTPTDTPTNTPTDTPTDTPTSNPTTTTPTTAPTTTTPAPGQNEFSNNTSYDIRDYKTVTSDIQSTYSGANKVTLGIDMNHSCGQHIQIAVTTPDGRRNVVKRASYAYRCSPWNGMKSETYTMRSASNGKWSLEVSDNYRGETGTLNGWSVKFA